MRKIRYWRLKSSGRRRVDWWNVTNVQQELTAFILSPGLNNSLRCIIIIIVIVTTTTTVAAAIPSGY